MANSRSSTPDNNLSYTLNTPTPTPTLNQESMDSMTTDSGGRPMMRGSSSIIPINNDDGEDDEDLFSDYMDVNATDMNPPKNKIPNFGSVRANPSLYASMPPLDLNDFLLKGNEGTKQKSNTENFSQSFIGFANNHEIFLSKEKSFIEKPKRSRTPSVVLSMLNDEIDRSKVTKTPQPDSFSNCVHIINGSDANSSKEISVCDNLQQSPTENHDKTNDIHDRGVAISPDFCLDD